MPEASGCAVVALRNLFRNRTCWNRYLIFESTLVTALVKSVALGLFLIFLTSDSHAETYRDLRYLESPQRILKRYPETRLQQKTEWGLPDGREKYDWIGIDEDAELVGIHR